MFRQPKKPDRVIPNLKFPAFLLLAFLLLSTCSKQGVEGGEGSFTISPRSSPLHGRMSFDILSDPKTFNPALASETTSTQILGYIFRGLTRLSPYDGTVKPDLADHWTIDPSGLKVTFTLMKGLLWSDGVPLTANDVVFTFNSVYYNPAVAAPIRDILTVDGKPFRVWAQDDRTVVFETARPFAPLLEELGFEILPEHLLASSVKANKFNTDWSVRTPPAQIVGTGPFRLDRYVPGQYVLMTRNPRYMAPAGLRKPLGPDLPYLDHVLLRIIPNQNSALLRFLSGKSDLIPVSPSQVAVLRDAEKSRAFHLLRRGPSQSELFLTFNQNSRAPIRSYKVAWFRDRRFRQAIAWAIDRKALINVIYNGLGAPIPGPISPVNRAFFYTGVHLYHHDLVRSRALLREAGFVFRKNRLYDGSGHKVTILLMTNTESPERLAMAQMIQAMLKPVGIKIRVVPLQFNMLSTMVLTRHQWEMLLFGLTGVLDPHGSATVWRSSGFLHLWNPGEKNPSSPWEKEVDRLFDEGVITIDPEKRKKIYDKWQEIATWEVPMIDLVSPDEITAVRKTLGGIHPTPLGGVIPHISLVTQQARLVMN